ncbi:MAG: hypothetical protein LBJ02_02205 [Bifidobacteriaceae bacterium]|nr:hypothetical protein [Bifidobacteriaceae bacterium]
MDRNRLTNAARQTGNSLAGEVRNWAKGTYRAEAAVELLLTGMRGRLAYRGAPWIEPLGTDQAGKAYARVNPAELVEQSGPLSSGERFVAKVVANLLDNQTLVPLADIARLDTSEARIVLGALRHAAGLKPPAAPAQVLGPTSAALRPPALSL